MDLVDPSDEPIHTNAAVLLVATAEEKATTSKCPVLRGPPHRLSLSWALSVYGSEYVALLLWIIKDWSWSQLGWTTTALFFGALAELWILSMAFRAYRDRLYSELYKRVTLFLWLSGLFAWMLGEFWTLWYAGADLLGQHALLYEERGNTIARWVLLAAVLLEALFFVVLVPFDVFASDRESPVMKQLSQARNLPCPAWAQTYFREFRVYSDLHLFTWVLKDCMWAWEEPVAYGMAFILTVLLNFDLLWRFATHRDCYIDFANYLVILFWVFANGLWATGELVANANATVDQFRRYTWPQWQIIQGTTFQFRYSAGWVFLFSGICLFSFYLHWFVLTMKRKLPSYHDFMRQSPITPTAPGKENQLV